MGGTALDVDNSKWEIIQKGQTLNMKKFQENLNMED